MTTPAIITVAITGAVPRKADTPAVPVTPAEQIEFDPRGLRSRRYGRAYPCAQSG